MTLDWAVICEAARVRENIGFILGAGIDTMFAQPLPPSPPAPPPQDPQAIAMPVQFNLIVRALLQRAELNRMHNLEIRIADDDGNQVLEVRGQIFAPTNPNLPAGWNAGVIFPIGAQIAPRRFGTFSLDIFGNGVHLKGIPFRIQPAPPQPAPPQAPPTP